MEETMSLSEMLNTLKKHWKLIVCLTITAAMIGSSISYFLLKPEYEASTQILVNQKSGKYPFNADQFRANIDMINTYSVIIKSPAILEKAAGNFNLNQTTAQLNQKITVDTQNNSQVFSLTVKDSDPLRTITIANAVSETFQKEIPAIMNVDNVTILAKAVNAYRISPKPSLNIAVALIVGLMAGIGLAFILEYMDKTIKDDRDVEIYLELPVLGIIHQISPGTTKRGGRKNLAS